jgi:hypothetical protein
MNNKYKLTRQENVFTIKKYWDESIYSAMMMEGRNVTFPQTKTILEKGVIQGVDTIDVLAINNFKKGWQFILDTLDAKIDLKYYKEINRIVAADEALVPGEIRSGEIRIGGTDYQPPVLLEADVNDCLSGKIALLDGKNTTEIALELFTAGCRMQNFWDGNKRTSYLLANKILAQNNNGMLCIWHHEMECFNKLLSGFYETGNAAKLCDFLYNKCIYGIRSDGETRYRRTV